MIDDRTLMVNVIRDTPLPGVLLCVKFNDQGLFKYNDSPWIEDWVWDTEALGKLTLKELVLVYEAIT